MKLLNCFMHKKKENIFSKILCPACNFYYCSACDKPMESHSYDDQYFFCHVAVRYGNSIEPKYENRKKLAIWNEMKENYMNEKEMLVALNERFFVDKDKVSYSNDKTVVSLSKLCIRTRIARVLLCDISDRNEVKSKTIKILNTIISAQSIITSAYPALFFIYEDPIKTELITEKIESLKQETSAFVILLDHPEHSSTERLQQNVDSLQKKIDDILEFSSQNLIF